MKKEDLLKVFYKYGFHSLNKEPFLYEGKRGVGISYTFKDSIYGPLTRIYIPKDGSDAEDFLAKYYWYKKKSNQYNIEIILSDYKIENPTLKYFYNHLEMSLDSFQKLEKIKDDKINEKENSYFKKIKRTAFLMLSIIEEKIKVQNSTYLNLLKLNEKYQNLKLELNEKKEEYNKTKIEVKKTASLSEDIQDYHNDLLEMKNYIKNASKEELEKYISILTDFLKSLEISDSFIKNKYELIRLPLAIDILNKQIKVVEEMSNKKKGFFTKKEDINSFLEEIKEQSDLKDIVSFLQYKTNEQKRVEEKYSMIPDLDIRTIGDFFIEFDNLNIKEPEIETEKKQELKKYSYEEAMEQLEVNFQKRSREEKQILMLYHSILKNTRIYLELDCNEFIKISIKEFIELIDHPNNILFKIKYFKNIDTTSIENSIKSLKKELSKIKNIAPEKVLTEINLFFKDGKQITKKKYLEASNKKLLAPSQKIEDNDVTYLATIKESTSVYFIPSEITYDFTQEDTLIQRNEQPFFLIDMEKNEIKEESSEIIKVAVYSSVSKKTEIGTIVIDLKNTRLDQYKKIIIGGKNR